MHLQFGITAEREQFLKESCCRINTDCIVAQEPISKALAEASKLCTHPNELAYCCYKLGGIIENMNNSGMLQMIQEALKKTKKQ